MSRMLFKLFTDQARLALALAREEAERLRARATGTEHLLLGLLRLPDAPAGGVLGALGVAPDEVRAAVEHEAGGGAADESHDAARPDGGLHSAGIVVVRAISRAGLTPAAERAISLAVKEARRNRYPNVDPSYLLLGLLREGDGIAATVLARFGVTPDLVAERLPQAADQTEPEPSETAAGLKNNVVTCRLDDLALDALDALVEAGIRPTRSDAAAWLISTGIEAHHALFERVHSTVNEIRKLRLEARTIAGQACVWQAEGKPERAHAHDAAHNNAHDEREQG